MVQGAPSDYAGLVAALDGVESVLLVVPGDAKELGRALTESQTRKAVLVSSITARTRPELAYARHLRENETLVRAAVPGVTILHPGQFASNALWWQSMVQAGTVRAPYGDVAIPVIDPIDIAAVAAVALVGDEHVGATFTLTGPERLSPRQKVEVLAEAIRRRVDFAEVTDEQFRAASPQMGPDLHDYLSALTGSPKPDELELTATVEQVTGRSPRTFADWVARNRLAFETPEMQASSKENDR